MSRIVRMRKMILGTAGLIVSDNKTDEVAETGQETATTETNAEAKTYYVKSGARKSKKVKKTFLRGGERQRAAAGRFSPRPDARQSRFGF